MDAASIRSLIAKEALHKLSGSSLASSIKLGTSPAQSNGREALPLSLPFSSVLPEGGFPQGSVVELASPANLGRSVSVALAACAAAQKASFERGRPMAWCAFLDPDQTLFGPAVQASGVCLERLLVLRPPRHLLARVAVRVAMSGIFSVIAVDVAGVPGSAQSKSSRRAESMQAWSKVTRRLALAVEKTRTTLFLMTEVEASRSCALPASMRIELENESPESMFVRIAKEKFGRVSNSRRIVWTRPAAHETAETLRASG
jgi:RecA/RadA recombinase